MPRNKKHARAPWGACVFLVAGTGIAPVPRGYEPLEVLLLHPASSM
jgi:hypothetical protein